ncbi:type I-E CRISPR-associated protein Cas5/CasD [Streptomyces albidoflavus]|uniref:type I-E CRISPR-associated protein Cas5/CasD n=1 Tax=Streptomyces albidoflavus TaxID=1886 RepID=UPI0033FAB0DC
MTTPTHAPGILLRLTGPLQSWGENSHYNYRDTAAFPTRSGLIGLLAAALGRPRHHPLDDLAPLSVTVRADRPGKPMRDFQTVGGGRPRHLTVTTADGGKRKENAATLTTDRWYLTDAAFTVALTHHDATPLPPAWAHALAAPRWPLYLGRRSCPPEGPLLLGTSDHALHDLVHLPLALPVARTRRSLPHQRHPADDPRQNIEFLSDRPLHSLPTPPGHQPSPDAGRIHSHVTDDPLSFHPDHRTYRSRPLYRLHLTLPTRQNGGQGTEQLTALTTYASPHFHHLEGSTR